MAHKQVLFRSAAREKIPRGATAITDAVRVTLGPKSKCVLIEKKWGKPLVCNDGVTIAKEVDLKDPEENLGAQMIRQVVELTGEVVGDGTSTATVLAHAILTEGVRNVTAGARAMTRDGIKNTVLLILGEIAPGADPSQLKPNASFRDQLDIDSMDSLNLVTALDKPLHIEVPETDHPKLAILDSCTEYLAAAQEGPQSDPRPVV